MAVKKDKTPGTPETADDAVAPVDGTKSTVETANGDAEEAPNGTGVLVEGVEYFSGTITKIDREGRTVMSDHLMPGETLAVENNDTAEKLARRQAATEAQAEGKPATEAEVEKRRTDEG